MKVRHWFAELILVFIGAYAAFWLSARSFKDYAAASIELLNQLKQERANSR